MVYGPTYVFFGFWMTTVAELGEVGLIRRIARRLGSHASVVVGVGDDTAVLRRPDRASDRLLFASDMLVEGVHFTQAGVPPEWIGWKAMASNISDIAAMGGRPTHAVVSVGMPASTPMRVADGLSRGLIRCAKRFGVAIVGGDTVRAPQLVVDVAILGIARHDRVTLRSDARVGDRVFVTGRLGGSLRSGRHARFIPRLTESQWLIRHVPIHAMMDLSDGLASDSWQIARASRVTLRIDEARVPVSRAARQADGKSPTWHALMDGEDFELLFTVPNSAVRRLPRAIGRVPLSEIGVVRRGGPSVELVRRDGRLVPLKLEGFRHFS